MAMKLWAWNVKNLGLRWWVAIFFLITDLFFMGFWWYMSLEVSNQEKIKTTKTKILADAKAALSEAQDDQWYKRYKAAKYVAQTAENLNWKENTEYLIELIDELILVDNSDRTLLLENMQITPVQITLRWSIVAIKSVYREWWVIDKFTNLWFIESIDIPYYTKNELEWWDFTFSLTADIKEYEW